MKALLPVILFSLPLLTAAIEVQPGDNLAAVRSALGAPRGQVRIGERQLLYYDRGEVELQSGTVARVELRSPDEQAVFTAQRSATQQRVLEENARLAAEGVELKARKLSDSDFRAAPLSYQVAFWETFAARYPGVSCGEQLATARAQLAEQQAEQYPQYEPPEVTPVDSEYVSSDSGSYYYPPSYGGYGYGRNHFGYAPIHRFSNPLLTFHARPSGQLAQTFGHTGASHHAGIQVSSVSGNRIRP